jgi:hypothetical protein
MEHSLNRVTDRCILKGGYYHVDFIIHFVAPDCSSDRTVEG